EGGPFRFTEPPDDGFIDASEFDPITHESVSKNGFLALDVLEFAAGVVGLSRFVVDRSDGNSEGVRVHYCSCPELAFSPVRCTGMASGSPCLLKACWRAPSPPRSTHSRR